MLGLKLPTDPRWANIAEKNIEEILTDHAFCEQKAASYAISLLVNYPELSDLVAAMSDLAQEEMQHFTMVHDKIVERGLVLGRERKDEYVHRIMAFFPKDGDRAWLDRKEQKVPQSCCSRMHRKHQTDNDRIEHPVGIGHKAPSPLAAAQNVPEAILHVEQ